MATAFYLKRSSCVQTGSRRHAELRLQNLQHRDLDNTGDDRQRCDVREVWSGQ
ncbi:MAG: hypothetical protein JWN70_6574 [Planctomycetaceae bacterium]|nr:hypothetical protein [Planctomycetaceae bacterium]